MACWAAAALRRVAGAVAYRSVAVPRAGCSLLVSWAVVELSRASSSNEVKLGCASHETVARMQYRCIGNGFLRHSAPSCMRVSVCARLAQLGFPVVSACSHRSAKLGDDGMQTCVGA